MKCEFLVFTLQHVNIYTHRIIIKLLINHNTAPIAKKITCQLGNVATEAEELFLLLSVIDGRQRHHVGELFVFDDSVRFDVCFFEKLVH